MAHLGTDVAAFVDEQLSPTARAEALCHLESCADCRQAVWQQRLLKDRVGLVSHPEPSTSLLASLNVLADEIDRPESWLSRFYHGVPLKVGAAFVSASLAVMVVAYLAGGFDERPGDDVTPAFERYVSEFAGRSAATVVNAFSGSSALDNAAMAALNESGWPCHEVLGGSFMRVGGRLADHRQTVALEYVGRGQKLLLIEHVGRLNHASLQGFSEKTLGTAKVWVRPGHPIVAAWDSDGMVYTVVTGVSVDQLIQVIADLPQPQASPNLGTRVGDGLQRMTAWISAAPSR